MKSVIKCISYLTISGSIIILCIISKVIKSAFKHYQSGFYSDEMFTNIMNNMLNQFTPIFGIVIILMIASILILRKVKKLP